MSESREQRFRREQREAAADLRRDERGEIFKKFVEDRKVRMPSDWMNDWMDENQHRMRYDAPPQQSMGAVEWVMIGVRKPDGEVVIAASKVHRGGAEFISGDPFHRETYLQLQLDVFEHVEVEGANYNDAMDVLIGEWDPDELPPPWWGYISNSELEMRIRQEREENRRAARRMMGY